MTVAFTESRDWVIEEDSGRRSPLLEPPPSLTVAAVGFASPRATPSSPSPSKSATGSHPPSCAGCPGVCPAIAFACSRSPSSIVVGPLGQLKSPVRAPGRAPSPPSDRGPSVAARMAAHVAATSAPRVRHVVLPIPGLVDSVHRGPAALSR
uniref:Uncharacterized protein n=1 Tax=Oryza sativa subsp. japonica TaxID=39947 RepID=Q60DU7_ORYSJ|nr:hypothetical protein [Oryza sativa Japonica Group]